MPQFEVNFTTIWQLLEQSQFGLGGRTTEYRITSAKLLAADRENAQIFILSGNLSAEPIQIAPLGISAPAMFVLFLTDQPVDIRTNAVSDTTFLSGVQLLTMVGHISNVFVTTGSADTTVYLKAAGGSNAVVQVSLPLP